MARQKRKSPVLDKAKLRLAGMKAIDPNLDLGDGFTVADVTNAISSLEGKLGTYNEHLSDLDDELNLLVADEKTMEQGNRRILQKVGSKYGYDSSEYEMVGGVRNSERKKPAKKKPGPAPGPVDPA